MLNKVMLIGNLGRDPEIRRTQDGRPIANLSIATSESWRDKQTGERREKTEWHRVVCFHEGMCGVIEQYTSKGSKIYVEGQLETRKWTDKDGVERYSTEVVMRQFGSRLVLLSPKGNSSSAGESEGEPGGAPSAPRARPSARPGGDLDDEIPF